MDVACISYQDTGFFSQTITDYIDDAPQLRPFYKFRPTLKGFAELLANKKVVADRQVLYNVLREQYAQISEFGSPISDFKTIQSRPKRAAFLLPVKLFFGLLMESTLPVHPTYIKKENDEKNNQTKGVRPGGLKPTGGPAV